MSPLQRVAAGLLVIVGTAPYPPHPHPSWARYDLLADPVGWVLVLHGTWALARHDRAFASLRWVGGLAGALSIPLWFPQLSHRLDASGSWFVSLPQLAYCLLLARAIGVAAAAQDPPETPATQKFGLLVWGFVVLAVMPVLIFGAGIGGLAAPTLLLSVLVDLALIWWLFSHHRRRWLAGPGPVEVQPAGTRRDRPPS